MCDYICFHPKKSFKIFVLGREIDKLVNENMTAGRYEVMWDARNYASGTYIYKLEAGTFTEIKKMILVK